MCECKTWAGEINPKYITNHHKNCPHYNDSLMDVYRVTDGGISYYTTDLLEAKTEVDMGEGDLTLTEEKIHREVYENLPEFDGF